MMDVVQLFGSGFSLVYDWPGGLSLNLALAVALSLSVLNIDCKCTALNKLAASAMVSATLSTVHGHFWRQKPNIATVKSLHTRLQNGS